MSSRVSRYRRIVSWHQSHIPPRDVPDPESGEGLFDVVISRQVLEHVPDPLPFLTAVRRHIAEDGIAYIEVPRAEYIGEAHSIVDFHYPHVHYYRREEIAVLFARAGFAIDDVVEVKSGHDIAFLLRPVTPTEQRPPAAAGESRFAEGLAQRRAIGRDRLAALSSPIGLYGANAYSQALLGLYPDIQPFQTMFDDTPQYAGQLAYGPGSAIPIGPPSAEKLAKLNAVIITAYLHDLVIARKIRTLGFGGTIFTVRSDDTAGRGDVPPGLFT